MLGVIEIAMNLRLIILLFTFLHLSNLYSQDFTPLTKKEKIADFKYLYSALKETYPYFGVNKRMNGVDWLSNKHNYLKRIKSSSNDTIFYQEINQMMLDLHSGHSDTYPTIIYNYFLEGYTQAAKEDSMYLAMVEELKLSSSDQCKHWTGIDEYLNSKDNSDSSQNNQDEIHQQNSNVSMEFNVEKSIAYISIRSFSYDLIEEDKDTLCYFFKKAYEFDNLVIDIQGNGGGSTEYWEDNIVAHLINKNVSYQTITAFKKNDRVKRFKPYSQPNTPLSAICNLPGLPDELKTGEFNFQSSTNTVKAISKDQKYTGKIYLLVDHSVFSSAEAFAFFCKATHFAKVVGTQTNGAGVGSDPVLLTLPNSGIVIRYTVEMGLNPDGSSNEEKKTQPDIKLNGKTREKRKKEIIDLI